MAKLQKRGARHRAGRSGGRQRRLLGRRHRASTRPSIAGACSSALKPLAERDGLSTARVIDRMRRSLARVNGISVFLSAAQDIRVGARQSDSDYQFTLWSPEIGELYAWVPKVVDSDRSHPGPHRCQSPTASRAACRPASPSTGRRPRGSACASRTSTTRSTTPSRSGRCRSSTRSATSIASSSRSIRACSSDPSDLQRIYVPGRDGAQVPLTSVITRRPDIRRPWWSTIRDRSRPSRSATTWPPA